VSGGSLQKFLHTVENSGIIQKPPVLTGGKALHTTAGGWPHFRKGGETMRFTFTFYIGRKTFTLSLVVKSNNRHPGR
jgi:hypothetical protein